VGIAEVADVLEMNGGGWMSSARLFVGSALSGEIWVAILLSLFVFCRIKPSCVFLQYFNSRRAVQNNLASYPALYTASLSQNEHIHKARTMQILDNILAWLALLCG
jgi:hypothetical protein